MKNFKMDPYLEEYLLGIFNLWSYPSRQLKEEISRITNLTFEKVDRWFTCQRRKIRKRLGIKYTDKFQALHAKKFVQTEQYKAIRNIIYNMNVHVYNTAYLQQQCRQ